MTARQIATVRMIEQRLTRVAIAGCILTLLFVMIVPIVANWMVG